MKSDELFKVIEDHPSYMISSHGRVLNTKRGRHLNGTVRPDGYIQVKIQGKVHFMHRLVANAFIDNIDDCPEVNHIDKVRSNNFLSNLEWCTRQHNVEHSLAGNYLITYPTGDTAIINNLRKFARDTGLSHRSLLNWAHGIHESSDGWRVKCL